MAYLRADRLCKQFITAKRKNIVCALENINFEVPSGEFFVIIGPTGCGKTTLLNIAAGFAKPSSGKILINEKEVLGPSWKNTMIFQHFALFPWLTVKNNIEFGLKMKKVARADRRKIVSDLIRMVGLNGCEDQYPYELSGGMKQRVAIARALAVEPQILLMDEPFGSLDAHTRETLHDILLKLWLKNKTTVLFVTHNIEESIKLGQRIMIMTKSPGKIKEIISIPNEYPRDIFHDQGLVGLKSRIHDILAEEAGGMFNNSPISDSEE